MRDFVVFFTEKEGTSALMRLLDNFEEISVVHQLDSSWEPFDRRSCGPMPVTSLRKCLDIIFGPEPVDWDRLDRIYTATARAPLARFSKDGSVGFKMRFTPQKNDLPVIGRIPKLRGAARSPYLRYQKSRGAFRRTMFGVLKRHDVVAFVAVRQDLLRWALSKYHGDGSGTRGHLQFKLASGQVAREDIPKIHVDCDRLARLITSCRNVHDQNRTFMEDLSSAGIATYPVFYEDFLEDQIRYVNGICDRLQVAVTDKEIEEALGKGAVYQRVHSDDLSASVTNVDEVLERFDDHYVPWS